MRWVFLAAVVVLAIIVVIFAVQNSGVVNLTLFHISLRAPLAFLALVFYVLGALTGAAAFAAVRYLVEGTRRGWRAAR